MTGPGAPAEDLPAALATWVAHQRWYSGKGRQPVFERIGVLHWPGPGPAVGPGDGNGDRDDAGEVEVQTWLLLDTADDRPTLYQVPLAFRQQPLERASAALVGTITDDRLGARHVYDAAHDPALVRLLLDLVQDERTVVSGSGPTMVRARGHRGPLAQGAGAGTVTRSWVLEGEQSNTSIVIERAGPDGRPLIPVLCKLLRIVHAGDNPDVVLQNALAAAGSTLVPQPYGQVSMTWQTPQGPATGHLAVAQEFVPDARDAWREASDAIAAGRDFADSAAALGRATARMHAVLASRLPTSPCDPAAMEALASDLLGRLEWTVRQVPELAARAPAARSVLGAVSEVAGLPAQQRIHGDLHLGQVLDGGARGWIIIDFEGEPMRPLDERVRPDLPARDVAGMLRSFDYVAGDLIRRRPGDDADRARTWSARCRDAFCAGYAEVAGRDPRDDDVLLRALELDKALYEVAYEWRHRPDWMPIPLAAVDRLLARPGVPPGTEAQPVSAAELASIVAGTHADPHRVLGPHPYHGGVTVRTLRPHAREVVVVLEDGRRIPLVHEHEGIFVGVAPGETVGDYRLDVTYDTGDGQRVTHPVDDPYRFLPTLGEVDLHLIAEGRHERLWTVLGAHVRSYPGPMGEVTGTAFAVWAPHARGMRLVGDVNHWDGTAHPMRSLGASGVWELFVPGVGAGSRYKFDILGADGVRRMKADPMARATETPPATASVVAESHHRWTDGAWMAKRATSDPHTGPMSVYEVHLGSWRQGLGYRQLADQLVEYVVDAGFTHVELLPVMEHPYGPSWGYQVTGYYAPTARFGTPDDFRHLVDRLHQAGVGVLLDWVPGHFPKDGFALARFDGQALYEHPDPRRGDQPDWGTHVFDFGRPEVRNFLVAGALYWCQEFHIDGLRVDAVASMLYLDYSREPGQWLPNRFGGRENLEAVQLLQEVNATVYRTVPGVVMIAEESTAWPGVTRPTHLGGLGFGLKWNMGWMHDTLDYVEHEPVHRQWHHQQMTFGLMYAWSENFVLPISHDEVVHGKGSLLRKMPGDRWQQLATVRAFLAMMWAHPGKQLLFMGSEFAQEAEWADDRGLDWWLLDQPAHRGVHSLVRDLNRVYRATPALWSLDLSPDGFRWIDANDAGGNVFSFLRLDSSGEPLACVANFAAVPHQGYRIGLPRSGPWDEVLNTDAVPYGGSGVGNLGRVVAEDVPWHGLPASVRLSVPPLGVIWLRPEPPD